MLLPCSSSAIELRQRFPGITDNTQARACARIIAGWKPLPLRPVKRMPKVPGVSRVWGDHAALANRSFWLACG
jgi:hypothetical protein